MIVVMIQMIKVIDMTTKMINMTINMITTMIKNTDMMIKIDTSSIFCILTLGIPWLPAVSPTRSRIESVTFKNINMSSPTKSLSC